MKLSDTLMLAAAANGIPPELLQIAQAFGSDLNALVQTSIERNIVETLRAKVQIAVALRGIPEQETLAKDLLAEIESEALHAFGLEEEEMGNDDGPGEETGGAQA